MFKVLTQTKLPPLFNQIIVLIGLLGLLLGLYMGYENGYPLPEALFRAAVLGVCFAGAAKYLMVKFLRAWLESKLQQAAKERDEARRKAADAMKSDSGKKIS